MIPYVEIINFDDKETLAFRKFAVIEPNECWFELSFFNVGECELYCRATEYTLNALKKGNFLKIPNEKYIWVITEIKYSFSSNGSRMITATGKEAKWLLNKRCILSAKELPTTFGGAIGSLLEDNIKGVRNLGNFNWRILDTSPIEPTQAPRGNLLDFILELCKTYQKGVQVIYENEGLYLEILSGNDLSNEVKFSQSYDNLISSTYYSSGENMTFAKTISKVNEIEYIKEHDKGLTGLSRNEIIIESNISTKYIPEGETEEIEVDPNSELYQSWLIDECKKTLANNTATEEVNGEIDMVNSNYEFDKHYFLGSIVKVQDEYFGYSFKTRILKFTIKQDSKGYGEEVDYGGE